MPTKITFSLATVLLATSYALGAGPTPESKKAFMDLKATYVSFDITQSGSQDFSAPKDALNDGAYTIDKSWTFELPLEMQLPGSCPSSTSMNDAMEEGRCMGWSFNIPDDPGVMDQMASGKLDMAKNPMFAPARYAVDDVLRFHYRDDPGEAFATRTRTIKGRGVTYVAKGGMLLCDFKRMICDFSGVSLGAHLGDDVTITTTDTVPGSETTTVKQEPTLLLPQVPNEISAKLMGWPLTLPGPSTVTFSAPGEAHGINGRPTVTLKMTISSKPTAGAGAVK